MSQALQPPGRGLDLTIGLGLAALTVALLVATDDMGFVRDEAFYFGDAEIYQDWFVRVQDPQQRPKALERSQILETWRNNSEHPPLDKILFGASWRLFGRKLRPISRWQEQAGAPQVEVSGLGPAHGFARGAPVQLLLPQEVGKSASPRGREIARGEVVDRTPYSASVRFELGQDLAALKARCPNAGPGVATAKGKAPIYRTGCEVLEQRKLYFLSESQAMRFPGALFTGLLVLAVYLAGRLWFLGRQTASGPGLLDRPFAAAAALGILAIPQPFWHAHLACFDMTITALLFLTSVVWLRALRARRWIVPTALLWGISLLAKHNALFLPAPLIGLWLWDGLAEGRIRIELPENKKRYLITVAIGLGAGLALAWLQPLLGLGVVLLAMAAPGVRITLPPIPAVFFWMVPIGLTILVAGWPLLWVDTLDNLLRWIEFHLHHEHYMQIWFGRVLAYPPFPPTYPWLMTLFTWPPTLLICFAIGLVAVYCPRPKPESHPLGATPWLDARAVDAHGRTGEQRAWERMMLLSCIWPMALISMPGTPIFGGTKHWMLAFPFMLLIGARGLQGVWRGLSASLLPQGSLDTPYESNNLAHALQQIALPPTLPPSWLRATLFPWLLRLILLTAAFGPAALATADAHPHGSAYWNELVGGVSGAAQANLMRQFWGGSTRDGLEDVNRQAPANALVYFHDAAWGAFQMYQREGWFRRDLRFTADPNDHSQLAIEHHAKDLDEYELDLMRNYQWRVPLMQSTVQGVPIVSVYARPTAAPMAPAPANPAQQPANPLARLPLPAAPSLRQP